MYRFLTILFFGLISHNVSTQSVEIELAVSYDQQYVDKYQQDSQNPFNSVEERVDAVVSGINSVYSNYGVHFNLVGLESFGYINLNSSNAPNVMTQAWVKKDGACYERDLVLHLTGNDLGVLGVTEGGKKLCISNVYDYDNGLNKYVVTTKYQSLWDEIKTSAHELGHAMGLSHEGGICSGLPLNTNDNYFMCQGGGGVNPSPSANFVLSSSNANTLNGTLNSSCVDRDDYVDVTCTEFIANFFGNTEIHTTCADNTIEEYNFFLKNNQSTRSFSNAKIILRGLLSESDFNNLGINNLIIDGVVTPISSLNTVYHVNQKEMWINLPNFTLNSSEELDIKFDFDFSNSGSFTLNYPQIAYFIFFSNVSPGLGLSGLGSFSRSILPETRTINLQDGDTATDLFAEISALEAASTVQVDQLEILINGTFTVDQDLEIEEKWNLNMGQDARIIVQNGVTLKIMNNSVKPCSNERWDEIYIESGGNAFLHNVKLEKGVNAIRTENNPNNSLGKSDITVHNCSINDFTDSGIQILTSSIASIQTIDITNTQNYGINIANDVNAAVLIGINVDGADRGIRIINSPYWNQVNECTFTNCHIGVRYNGSSGSIHDSDFNNNNFPITVNNSFHSFIYKNDIGYNQRGVTVTNSFNTNINRNNIGVGQIGFTGISLSNVSNSKIQGNPSILANRFGILGLQVSSVDILPWRDAATNDVLFSNDITVTGSINTSSSGILFAGANNCQVYDNFVYGTNVAAGIEFNNSSSSFINNNLVDVSSGTPLKNTAAIRMMGSASMEVRENETYSSDVSNGILAQNSPGGSYECNFIYDALVGLAIEHNSTNQHLEANRHINIENIDFLTRSRLGRQENLGNEFWGNLNGGTYAGGVVRGFFFDDDDLQNSQFLVNNSDQYHLPTDINPLGWFVPNNSVDKECSGTIGPAGSGTVFSNETQLCDFWDDIKSIRQSDPKLFSIRIIHILKYFNANPLMAIPDCISTDPIYTNICGAEDVTDIIMDITITGEIDSSRSAIITRIEDMETLQLEYESITDPLAKLNKYDEIIALNDQSRPDFQQEVISDSINLSNIKTNLSNINCTDSIVTILKDALLEYLEEMERDPITNSTMNNINTTRIRSYCSDQYSDGVHLARAVTISQENATYYDSNDGCRDNDYVNIRTVTAIENEMTLSISPNPSSGVLNIDLGLPTSGALAIYNANGILITNIKIIDSNKASLTINDSGIYFARFTSNEGNMISKKFIIIR